MLCINTIRNLPGIGRIIAACSAFGRTWGRQGSPLHGSHIAFINQDEVVLLVQAKKTKEILLLEFKKAGRSGLGDEISAELDRNGVAYTRG